MFRKTLRGDTLIDRMQGKGTMRIGGRLLGQMPVDTMNISTMTVRLKGGPCTMRGVAEVETRQGLDMLHMSIDMVVESITMRQTVETQTNEVEHHTNVMLPSFLSERMAAVLETIQLTPM
mmetsp:Transcript_4855/g.7575  ORF Transcript_4855/g.7575 Transcript_4855/m.7575 type:complete len:120 (-) Transcript_4855:408-767(-)